MDKMADILDNLRHGPPSALKQLSHHYPSKDIEQANNCCIVRFENFPK